MDVKTQSHENTDAVTWNEGGPTAPPIIPITFFVVLIAAILIVVVKFIQKKWNQKHRSDTYDIVDLMAEHRKHESNGKLGGDPSLSAIKFTGVLVNSPDGSFTRGSPDIGEYKDVEDTDTTGDVSLKVEVHDSSNELNESSLNVSEIIDDMIEVDEVVSNAETLPLRKAKKKKNKNKAAPLAATESDV
ncbi:hypothetical protein HDE_04688 [Halotydeus destructor]|nr:hypothetical protein HDE_04688 [Halotydeus destructor]